MNPTQNESDPRKNVKQFQADNARLDQDFLGLIRQATSKLRKRAHSLGLEPLAPEPGFILDPDRAAIAQLALALTDLRISVRGQYPKLSAIEVAQLSMADTFLGRALGFGFRSGDRNGIVSDTESTMTAAELQTYIGKRLAEKRTDLKLSQKEVAAAIGMSAMSVWRVEAGKQRLGMTVLFRFLGALNMHPSEVLPPEAFPYESELPTLSLEQLRELRSAWPKFDREVLQRWEDKLSTQEKRSKTKDG